jgi:hypothetical protein
MAQMRMKTVDEEVTVIALDLMERQEGGQALFL